MDAKNMDESIVEGVEDVESRSGCAPKAEAIAAELRALNEDPRNKKMFPKIDIRIILVLGIVYSISVIDRINIGQVQIFNIR